MGLAQIQTIPEVINVLKVLMTGLLAFLIAFFLTPVLTHFLYKYKIGIKIKENSVDGEKLTYISELHKNKEGTPTMGGLLVWFSVLIPLQLFLNKLRSTLSQYFLKALSKHL